MNKSGHLALQYFVQVFGQEWHHWSVSLVIFQKGGDFPKYWQPPSQNLISWCLDLETLCHLQNVHKQTCMVGHPKPIQAQVHFWPTVWQYCRRFCGTWPHYLLVSFRSWCFACSILSTFQPVPSVPFLNAPWTMCRQQLPMFIRCVLRTFGGIFQLLE